MAGEMICVSLFAGETGTTLSTNYLYTNIPFQATIVGVVAETNVDDANITVDINGGGSALIEGIAVVDQDAPGIWLSTHLGGTNTPVAVAADTELSLDANNADANTAINVHIYMLVGSLT
jgi:hypothetical protein